MAAGGLSPGPSPAFGNTVPPTIVVVPPEAFRLPNYLTIPAIGIPLLFLFLIVSLIIYGRKRPKVRTADLYRMIAEVTEPAGLTIEHIKGNDVPEIVLDDKDKNEER